MLCWGLYSVCAHKIHGMLAIVEELHANALVKNTPFSAIFMRFGVTSSFT